MCLKVMPHVLGHYPCAECARAHVRVWEAMEVDGEDGRRKGEPIQHYLSLLTINKQ